ncbi:hypothetical protein Glove_485g10 [Diversispora epigaea]|uniref:Uncharacterized protein n=1 Tax=Diversispora epigaea TaxID=1348612 RepID=A0A397GJA3_9GLOM|nr:hypothetical protein Glove_485g10 [Diversispora epigaea]
MFVKILINKDKNKYIKIKDKIEKTSILTKKNNGKDIKTKSDKKKTPISTNKNKGEELITIDEETFITPELKEVYKKLDRRMKERYHKCKTNEGKIVLLETIRYHNQKGDI